METKCPHCGKENPEKNRHCIFCGKLLAESEEGQPGGGGRFGPVARYAFALLACAGIIVLYIFLCALMGWEHGGGVLPIALLFGFVSFAWGAITKR